MPYIPGLNDVSLGVEATHEFGTAGIEVAVMVGYCYFGSTGCVNDGSLDIHPGHLAVVGVAGQIASSEVTKMSVAETQCDGEDVFVRLFACRQVSQIGQMGFRFVFFARPDFSVCREDAGFEGGKLLGVS